MFSKLFALLIILVVLYGGLIFLAPTVADKYGNPEWNEKVRMMKRASELDTAGGATSGSLLERASDIAKPYIDETKATTTQIKTTLDEKTEQARQAAEAAQKAYDTAQEAKQKFDSLTNFGTGK